MPKRRSPGDGSIYLRKSDGKWVGTVELGIVNGKRKRKQVYGATKQDVKDKQRALILQQEMGANVAPERLTVAALLDRWLKDVARLRVGPRTLERYAYDVNHYLIPKIGHVQLQKLTSAQVQTMISAWSSEGLSPKTIQNVRMLLGQALKTAIAWDLITRNVAESTTLPRQVRPSLKALTQAQARQLLAGIRGHRLEAVITTALLLGLRRGEVLGLCWQDVDWTAQTLTVQQTVVLLKHKPVLSTPKTEASRRTLPMPFDVQRVLLEEQERQAAQRLAAGAAWQEQGLIFTIRTGRYLHPVIVLREFHKLLEAAGLPSMRFHDLRRSCASLLAAANEPPRVAQEILGHTDIRTTLQTYTMVYDGARRGALDRLGSLLQTPHDEEKEG